MPGFGTTVLETKNTDAVVFIFLKHNGLGRVADLNYFYSEKSIPCTNVRVRVTPFACTVVTVHAICEGLARAFL